MTTGYTKQYTVRQAYLEAHIAVFLWAFTAILGDVITLSALAIVWWRVCIASFVLLPFVSLKPLIESREQRKSSILLCLNGCILALHWLTFYATVKLSNASLTLVCMSLTPLFTAIIEARICRQSIKKDEIFLGMLIVPAMIFIASKVDAGFQVGMLIGVLSSFLAACTNAVNKRLNGTTSPLNITFVQMFCAFLLLSLFLPIQFYGSATEHLFPYLLKDMVLLFFLGVCCTAFTFVLAMRSLKHLSAFALSLTIGLEPVYGIILAALLLEDYKELSPNFYIGALIIILAVCIDAAMKKRRRDAAQ